jgi:hypothetical protein
MEIFNMESSFPHLRKILPGPPNQLQAMSNHFAQLLPAFSVANVGILIPALTDNIPKHYLFSTIENNIVIAVLSISSSLFFYFSIQKSYAAQSHNILEMDSAARKFFFFGDDPFEHCFEGNNYEENESYMIVNGFIITANSELHKAILRLEIGEILLFISISYVFFSYNRIIGAISFSLAMWYIAKVFLEHHNQIMIRLSSSVASLWSKIKFKVHRTSANSSKHDHSNHL